MRRHELCNRGVWTAALLTLVSPAIAADGATPDAGWGMGVEAMALDRSYEITGPGPSAELSADGMLAGLHLSWRRGPLFRGEARVLAGGVEYELAGAGESSDPAVYADIEGTWGFALPGGARLYAGVGGQGFKAEFPGDNGDETTGSMYLPIGISKAGALHGGWYVTTGLEAQLVIAGRHEFDGDALPGGDAQFDRYGGWGAEISARFWHPDTPVRIVPYVSHSAPADSETTDVGGVDRRIESMERTAAGVRFVAAF